MKRPVIASFAIALILGVFPFPLAAAAASVSDSHNWSGYEASGSGFSSVSADWTIPGPTSSSTVTGDATWVGIGGMQSLDLIQAGTRALTGSAGTSYEAWYELLPSPATVIAMSVAAGDQVHVSLTETASDTWRVSLEDLTSGKDFSASLSYHSSGNSAEWIDEAPQENGVATPLDSYGWLSFSKAEATKDGDEETPAALLATSVSLVDQSLVPLAAPSALSSAGDAFTITRD